MDIFSFTFQLVQFLWICIPDWLSLDLQTGGLNNTDIEEWWEVESCVVKSRRPLVVGASLVGRVFGEFQMQVCSLAEWVLHSQVTCGDSSIWTYRLLKQTDLKIVAVKVRAGTIPLDSQTSVSPQEPQRHWGLQVQSCLLASSCK